LLIGPTDQLPDFLNAPDQIELFCVVHINPSVVIPIGYGVNHIQRVVLTQGQKYPLGITHVEGRLMTENRSKPDQYQLRFPPGMRDRLKAAAIGNGRSMNAEIISRLEESFDPEVHKALHERGYLLGAVEGLIEAKFEEL